MTKTFKELQEVDNLVAGLYRRMPKLAETKFGYAYKRFSDKIYVPVVKEFQAELEKVRVDAALEDTTTKEILIDRMNPRGFKYSKAGLKQVIFEEKKILEQWDEKPIEIVPFLSVFVPDELTEFEIELLRGIVIDEAYVQPLKASETIA